MEGTKFGTIANQRENSWIISLKVKHLVAQWPFTYAGNKINMHQKKFITDYQY